MTRPFTAAPRPLIIALALLLSPVARGAPPQPATSRPVAAAADADDGAPGEHERALRRTVEALRRHQARLERRLGELERREEQRQLDLIRSQADAEASSGGESIRQADAERDTKAKVFRGGQRALQALNPEISVVGDALGLGIINERGYATEQDRSGFVFRMIGVHIQSDLDPFSLAKVTVGVTPEGAELGEAYMTWTGVLPGVSLTAGKFRQEFGVVNRWHLPGLDQHDWPLALREIFGPGGLNQVGLSVDWLMPRLWAHTNHLVLQLTNGQNDRLFAGKLFSVPAVLARLKSYYDLTEATYLEIGLTGMLGWNNARGAADEQTGELSDEPWRATWLWGADWTLVWEPLKRAKYRNVVLRGEIYGARKQLPHDTNLQAIGLYQSAQAKLSRHLELGARFDWSVPLIPGNEGQHVFACQPYLTWWQSPWVRLRLHYVYSNSDARPDDRRHDHRVIIQGTFAAGPHKHERY